MTLTILVVPGVVKMKVEKLSICLPIIMTEEELEKLANALKKLGMLTLSENVISGCFISDDQ